MRVVSDGDHEIQAEIRRRSDVRAAGSFKDAHHAMSLPITLVLWIHHGFPSATIWRTTFPAQKNVAILVPLLSHLGTISNSTR